MNKTIRKVRKQKERERSKAAKQQHKILQRLYPRFEFQENEANPKFIEIIKKATKSVDLSDRSIFTDWEIELYKMGKKYGGAHINDFMTSEEKVKTMYFLCKIGQLIFNIIGQKEVLNWIPFHDFRIIPAGRKIIVQFASLKSKSGPNGTIYYSPFEPKMQGSSKIIAFSRHAIEQICSRMVPRWQSYAGAGDAFGFLYSCVYFESCQIKDGFTFYDRCSKEFWTYNYVTHLIGNPDPKKKYYYRIGYCPSSIEGDFIKAKTLLFPGYRGTPELNLLYDTVMPHSTRKQFIEKSEKLSTLNLLETGDFSMIKWFHDNGITQVIDTNKEVYRYK